MHSILAFIPLICGLLSTLGSSINDKPSPLRALKTEVRIEIKDINRSGTNYFTFFPPIGGFFNRYFPITDGYVKKNHQVQISFDLESPSFAQFYLGKDHYLCYIEPGDIVTVTETLEKGQHVVTFQGNHSEANNLYKKRLTPEYRERLTRQILSRLDDHDSLVSYVNAEWKKTIQPYEDLLKKGKLSEVSYSYFYTALYLEFFDRPLLTVLLTEQIPLYQSGKFLAYVFDEHLINSSLTVSCIRGRNFLSCYGRYLKLKNDFRTRLPEYSIFGMYQYYGALSPIQQEFCLASNLVLQEKYAASAYDYEKALAFFKSKFKESPFIPYIASKTTEVKSRVTLKVLTESANDSAKATSTILRYENGQIVIIDSAATLSSLEELAKHYSENSSLYIDFWATWCIPCILEFDNKSKTHQILADKNVMPVYVSIDEPGKMSRWIEIIQRKELNGLHVYAGDVLKNNLETLHKINTIPRYMLTDSQGKTINNDAPRPSDLRSLEEVIGKIN
ncbi:Thioredoxin-like [Parapedobacter luteus]|uniref:Thioredoxin-like n=1 Tax=Parapedobacter luteus TaxID=623280 RepID=A0A1T4ZV65_9SPHI|nr:thioredoxin-like domain-containing protein [Parapedobacter luteus]SKB26566.1 Thioredoxin-like [Parapedobacter luteus]